MTTFKIDVCVAKLLARCYICSVEAVGCVDVSIKTGEKKDLAINKGLTAAYESMYKMATLDRSSKVMHF